jgi:pectate lyase
MAGGAATVLVLDEPTAASAAFPGAEGFGADTSHGRGGQVIAVTTLADSGSGSLRAALQASGPRIVVFRVAGYIDLQSPIEITNGNLMVAGQTAPGDGITVRSANGTAEAALKVKADNVVLRYFRVRPGTPIQDHHIIGINPGKRVVLDHMSVSWNGDEQLIVYGGASDVTIQWSLDSEGLNAEGGAVASKGMVQGPAEAVSRVSAHHNLFAHNNQRNPNTRGASGTIMDWRFNTVYNYGATGFHLKDAAKANIVLNTVKAGPNHKGKAYIIADQGATAASAFASGNTLVGVTLGSATGSEVAAPAISGGTAAQEHARVLAEAGASARLDCEGKLVLRRDAVDARIVAEYQAGTDSIPSTWLNDESQVGGYPPLAAGTACADSDGDGMPDAFEASTGLTDAKADADGDGYTNVEEYLNGTGDGSPPPTTTEPPPTTTEPPPTTTEPPPTTTEPSTCPTSGTLVLRVVSETASKITLGWDAVAGADGFRFSSSANDKRPHTWDGTRTSVTFANGADCYGVEVLEVTRSGSRP